MAYLIRVMYGANTPLLKRFRFDADIDDKDGQFDKAVKELNRLYKENGRFATKEEVVQHFRKYGFYHVDI